MASLDGIAYLFPGMVYEIILDHGETGNKCTIAPLADRPDFRLFRVHGEGLLGPLSAPILLHHEGECLSTLRGEAVAALASIDCVWRRLPRLVRKIAWKDGRAPVLGKIPEGFRTAYPRRDSQFKDPDGGLATIEAIFIASALLGKWDTSLLAKYYFGRRFVDLNAERFLELGVKEAGVAELLPREAPPPRNAWSRRVNRGRGPQA